MRAQSIVCKMHCNTAGNRNCGHFRCNSPHFSLFIREPTNRVPAGAEHFTLNLFLPSFHLLLVLSLRKGNLYPSIRHLFAKDSSTFLRTKDKALIAKYDFLTFVSWRNFPRFLLFYIPGIFCVRCMSGGFFIQTIVPIRLRSGCPDARTHGGNELSSQ